MVLSVLAIGLFVSGAVLVYGYYTENERIEEMRTVVQSELFHEGITINGIPMGGLSYEDGLARVEAYDAEQMEQFTAVIRVEDREWAEDVPVTANTLEVVNEAYALGRSGTLEEDYAQINSIAQGGAQYETKYSADPSALHTLASGISAQVDVEAVDATVSDFDVKKKTFTFSEEQSGRKLDVERLLSDLETAIATEAYPIQITGQMVTVEPAVTKAELEVSNKLLATFTTKTTKNAARNKNIELCSAAIDGSVILPGETFSINDTTGKRSVEKGYQEAGAILNGRLVPEPGGGVCQVSTTLFNAAVRAGFEIVERNNHSYPIDYVEKGHDAMIDYPNKDLKFTNISTGPVYLVAYFADRTLTIEFYGTPILENGIEVTMRTEITEEIPMPAAIYEPDPNEVQGTEIEDRKGRTGYRMLTYIEYNKGGAVVETKTYKSSYSAIAPVIKYGTKVLDTINPSVTAPPVTTTPAPDGEVPLISN